MSILREDDNVSENFGSYEEEKSLLKKQVIKEDHRNLVGKSSDIGSCIRDILSGHTPQDGLLTSESLSFLREVSFNKQEFPADKPILNMKYHYLDFQNNNPFHLFNN